MRFVKIYSLPLTKKPNNLALVDICFVSKKVEAKWMNQRTIVFE